ncbi:DUF362 domain-containing protein [Methanosphaerula palustris]|uniref:4Fe-4S ferredoxin-type domain-containing protein n=1 Tax=Methanosphaerula palustris (strain ATCC BAA-1556 / DSM 19958 / E1-9c) TaxID=521011 RepID=B8GKV1_METPE|nr:DUF362 domain-containing protein [Methanosphaerula palustris]ACL17247.1 protein of unknown function DUF362 [Methanosphaerula palustris E1-9c]
MASYTVSLTPCQSYDLDEVRAALTTVLEPLGGLAAFVHPGDRVLIKLNLLSSYDPSAAVTTNPALVRAVVEQVYQIGAIPLVGDSPGGRNTPASYRALLKRTGIAQVIEETGCESIFFDDQTVDRSSDQAKTFRRFTVAAVVDQVDVVITLPKLKTHQLTGMTGAVKVLYGFIPGVKKAAYHLHTGNNIAQFAELLLDLHQVVPPTLVIMDAVVGMEGNGPSHGTPRAIGLLFAGTSSPAIDFVAASVIGFDPLCLPTVKEAADRGVGPSSFDQIAIAGPDPALFTIADFKMPSSMSLARVPPFVLSCARRVLGTRPVVDRARCTRCGTCRDNCPPEAITMKVGDYPMIDQSRCIACFCCQELCPAGAIEVKKPLLRRLIERA